MKRYTRFRARLSRLAPDDKIRVMVLLRTAPPGEPSEGSATRERRQESVERMREAMAPALADLDAALKRHGGERLAPAASALGSIPVEITVRGIDALAELQHVKAILEDQPVSLLR